MKLFAPHASPREKVLYAAREIREINDEIADLEDRRRRAQMRLRAGLNYIAHLIETTEWMTQSA